jgi:ABC-type molybdate transport system substrate-binding protein
MRAEISLMLLRIFASVLLMISIAQSTFANETVLLHAAGSLRNALLDVAKAYTAESGNDVTPKFGASGLLKDAIAGGEKAEVFASANMEHPHALAKDGKAGPVVLFARNRLCALVKPGLAVTSATLLDNLLDAKVKVGTSTPKADPSGDYAFEVFARAEAVKAGSRAVLEKKALLLTGGPTSPQASPGKSLYAQMIADGTADIFLTYCTGALSAQQEHADQQIVQLPDNLGVGADYGLTVMLSSSPAAYRFAMFILSSDGQRILTRHGFSAPGLPSN